MEQLNYFFNLLYQGFNYYLGTMMNFKAAYPVLALFTLSGLLVAITYLTVKSFRAPKPEVSVFDIKARIEKPTWYIKVIITVFTSFLNAVFTALTLLIEAIIKVVFGLYILGMKVYFFFQLKKIQLPKD